MTAFLDTNVLVYAFDDRDTSKQATSLALLSAPGRRFVLSAQVLGEFYVAVTRKLPRPLSPDAAAATISDLSTTLVVPVDRSLVTAAIKTAPEHQLSYWDALIIEAAVVGRCDRLLTEDLTSGQTIRGVEIVNPFD